MKIIFGALSNWYPYIYCSCNFAITKVDALNLLAWFLDLFFTLVHGSFFCIALLNILTVMIIPYSKSTVKHIAIAFQTRKSHIWKINKVEIFIKKRSKELIPLIKQRRLRSNRTLECDRSYLIISHFGYPNTIFTDCIT